MWANQAANPLDIQPRAAGMTNTGTLHASDGATLVLSGANGGVVTNTGGTIEAFANSVVQVQEGMTIIGGTLRTKDNGLIRTAPGKIGVLNGVTIAGVYEAGDGTNNTVTRLANTITNTGTLAMNSGVGGGLVTTLQLTTNVTLTGTGLLTMGNSVNNVISGQTGTQSLTNSASHTIQEVGQIQVALLNLGTVRASGSSGLAVNQGITGPTGTIEIATNGILTLGGATESSAGTLIHNGAAANSLNLGNNNITVYTDYINANLGTGNSFNARANIAVSSGQILAAGTPAQAQVLSSVNLLGGSSLTNGNTATPTPTIGNVHVGSTKLTYQIANNNVGGPAIRGAIQTTVGGANITDGQLSGSGVTAGNFGPIAAGSNATFGVTFNAASAGPLTLASGQVVRIANNFDNVTDQNMSIVLGSGAAAYNLAAGNATPSPVPINNQRVGGSLTQALTVSNTVPSGSFTEVLNASFGANTAAAINNGGSITGGLGTGGVAAGGPDNSTAMSVGVDTTTAGAKSGTVRLNYVSNGTGTSGLGNTNVGSQIITVSGNVYQVAQPSVPTSADLGNVHVGTNPTQAITIGNTNISPQNFQEGLNVAVGGTTGGATGSGSITNLAAGSTSTAISVGLNNAAAGNQSGSVAVNLETNGSGTSGLASHALPQSPASVTVQATGYRLAAASPHTPEPVDLGNIRVGGSFGTQMLSVQNTAANDDFSENLNASIGGATGGASGSGSFNLLAPQATNGTGLVVGLGNANTNVAGAKTGTATISFVSDGTDTSGLGQTPMTGQNQTVNVSGNVYQPAAGQLNTPTSLNFGTVQVGQAVSQNLSISNVATGPANFVEDLNARFGATSLDFHGTLFA